MPRVLLVKTSSLGDVVHNLPVVSDIAAAIPGAQIDWVVEDTFAAVPKLHPDVRRVMPVSLRGWRRRFLQPETWREIACFGRDLRRERYDAVLDTQGLLKSALVTRAAHGTRYGLDWRSSREPLFAFYDRTMSIPRAQPAIERNRQLASRALHYTHAAHVNFGIGADLERLPWLPEGAYAVLIHGTSALPKLWPESRWVALGRALRARGARSVLPWGSSAEQERSARLASSIPDSVVPQRLPLADVARVLAHAWCAVGVDTGLTHLAGALGTATVGIYTATDPRLTGLYGCARAVNVGGPGGSPDVDDVMRQAEGLVQ